MVAFPTGTTYGLAVNVLNANALARLTDLKGRMPDKAYSTLLPSSSRETYVDLASQEGAALDTFAGRPLTLLVRARPVLAALAKDGRVGVRTADHPFVSELVGLLKFPVTATSANPSGQPPAYSIEDLTQVFPKASFRAVDGGILPKRPPSTVARWTGSAWEILREGEVRLRDLREIV